MPAAADFDRDYDVDGDDFSAFAACVSGPAVPLMAGCAGRDLDHDGDVDQEDFGVFQRCWCGSGRIMEPDCAR